VPLKAVMVEEELARLGLDLHKRARGRGRRVLADAYTAGEAGAAVRLPGGHHRGGVTGARRSAASGHEMCRSSAPRSRRSLLWRKRGKILLGHKAGGGVFRQGPERIAALRDVADNTPMPWFGEGAAGSIAGRWGGPSSLRSAISVASVHSTSW
jgi:hypothetical protein